MKKVFVTVLFLGVLVFSLKGQIAYYDAAFIKDSLISNGKFKTDDNSIKNLAGILKNYLPENIRNDTTLRSGAIITLFIRRNNNAFFKSVDSTILNALSSGSPKPGIVNKLAGSLSSLDVTKFANAIADIMIERAKQELTIAFFDRFKKFAKNNPEFSILFPKTTENLSTLLSSTYPQMLPKLRNGFFDDIGQITYNLEAVMELPKYRSLLDNFPEVRVAIRSLKLIHELENGELNAAEIIKRFSEFPEWTNEKGSLSFMNMGSTIRFAALFSESLRSSDPADTNKVKVWVSTKEIKKLATDDVFTRLYLGLLYQKIITEQIKYHLDSDNPDATTDLKDIFARQKDNILLIQNKISQFISLAENVTNSYKDITEKKLKKIKLTNDDYFNYIGVSIDVIDYSFGLVKIFDKKLEAENYLAIVKKSNSLYKDIYTKQYTQAVSDALDIIKQVQDLSKKSPNPIQESTIAEALPQKEASEKLFKFIEKLTPYAIFMANMIEATDEAGVKAALENVILPVGSSSIKKNTLLNISIQSYLGAYLSTSGKSSTTSGSWSDKFGVTAPIGISLTPSFFSWGEGGSLSLFASLFDIGAIVDYKLKKDSIVNSAGASTSVVSKDYSVKLGQLFSPGVYAVYGCAWNLPLSLGFGAQYGPGLSRIDAGNSAVLTNPYWRWNFFLAVDLPFFNLVNKSKHTQSK